MLDIVLCDENDKSLRQLENLIRRAVGDGVNIVRCRTSLDVQGYVIDDVKGRVDAIYISTRLEKESGIIVAKNILAQYPQIKIVFTSENIGDAKDIFMVNPIYFLVKPFAREHVKNSVYKLIDMSNEEYSDKIIIKDSAKGGGMVSIPIKNIYYIESELRVVHIYTGEGVYSTYMNLDDLQERLKDNFLRCHKSFMVNIDRIKSYMSTSLMLYNGVHIPISRSYVKQVSLRLKKHYTISDMFVRI